MEFQAVFQAKTQAKFFSIELLQDVGEGGGEDGHPVHDRPRRIGEGRADTGLSSDVRYRGVMIPNFLYPDQEPELAPPLESAPEGC